MILAIIIGSRTRTVSQRYRFVSVESNENIVFL
nr:MAG TPA: hypothetical protein [Bacteriophage sp.]